MKYRIISIDGGGIYGIISTVILRRIMEKHPNLLKEADLIAGTSIGGIIALCLAAGYSPKQLQDEFVAHAQDLFTTHWLRVTFWALGFCSKYSNDKLKTFVSRLLTNKTLGDLEKKVFVPAFSLRSEVDDSPGWRSKFFHNILGCEDSSMTPALEAALATSAAPTYFPSMLNYIDGGLAATNPTLAAVCQTQDTRATFEHRPSLNDIVALSIGQDVTKEYLDGVNLDWGWLRWANPLVEMLLDTNNRVTSYQCDTILNDRHVRISTMLDSSLAKGIDSAWNLPNLISFAEGVNLDPYLKQLSKVW
jgi:uncharacterized protein